MDYDKKFDIKNFITITKAISDPQRVRLLMALRKGERCLCQLVELLGLAPSTVSKHLLILKVAGLVENRKENRWVYYRLTEDRNFNPNIGRVIDLLISLLEKDEQIASDDAKMAEITAVGLEFLCKRQAERRPLKNRRKTK